MQSGIEFPPVEDSDKAPSTEAERPPTFERVLQEGRYLDAGKDGIVMLLTRPELSEESLRTLAERGVTFESDAAVKILKVSDLPRSRHEFEYQERSYGVLESERAAAPAKPIARVPQPQLLAEEKLTPTEREFLNAMGANLKDEAELIFMDFIPGDDLMTRVSRFIIRKNEPELSEEDIARYTPEMARAQAARLLQADAVTEKNWDPGERTAALRDLLIRKVTRFLKENREEFRQEVPADLIPQLENAIQALHRNGIYHNDLHEKNVMIHEGQAYLIDFTYSDRNPAQRDEGERDLDFVGLDDKWLIGLLKDILGESGRPQQEAEWKNSLEFTSRNFRQSPKYEEFRRKISEAPEQWLNLELTNALALGTLENTAGRLWAVMNDPETPEPAQSAIREFFRTLADQPAVKKSHFTNQRLAKSLGEAA